MDWTKREVELIISDYFDMLALELANKPFNKSAHRSTLAAVLDDRSGPAIEFKHQNISAVLIEMGRPFIKGYKPRYNYQQLLVEVIQEYIDKHQVILETMFETFSDKEPDVDAELVTDFQTFLDDSAVVSKVKERLPLYRPIKINYLEKEQHNRSLGAAGERLIIEFEKWRLTDAGKESLADKIEWISKEQGDGTGFDILSKNNNGTDRYIEVKTTKLSKETPIYVTNTEISFASLKEDNFYLYRVYNFEKDPKFFMRNGKFSGYCKMVPQTYRGYFF